MILSYSPITYFTKTYLTIIYKINYSLIISKTYKNLNIKQLYKLYKLYKYKTIINIYNYSIKFVLLIKLLFLLLIE